MLWGFTLQTLANSVSTISMAKKTAFNSAVCIDGFESDQVNNKNLSYPVSRLVSLTALIPAVFLVSFQKKPYN